MIIKILGAGCDKCHKAVENTKKAIEELGIDATIEEVEDLITMMKYGVMSTPGIVIDEKVVLVGRIPEVEDIKKIVEGK
ncbi:TM0996/MTH895 family glutaredoxin-like protein [Tissierella sp. MSJ-40]|uniref:TM0996/MTH895 family glutaredoxin-like protein n=1 Tax=Tissierella simiarum TaxID=2841534 RepID=A0ABS6E231_9FIRM|nr:thioredoxin family protein [Tissierella simiarum]MBU5436495.1 TM0996/MTH895 family glutaredoxin-like protein [Tissierella simiarum]